MEQVSTGGRAASISLCISRILTWRAYGPLPYSPVVCQTPTHAPLATAAPAAETASATQRSPADWTARTHSLTAASAHSNGMALVWKRAVATAAVAPGRAASASDRRGAHGLVGER